MSGHKVWGWVSVLVLSLAAASAQATSHVRIVRLSYTDGNVQMDRATNQGLERAILNSPIVEGARIVTGADGLAEVEFENNSVVRLGEATEVRFRQLLINDAGDKVNEVELVRGTMYFDTRSGKSDIYRVIAVDKTFVLRHDSRVRFQMSGDQVQAAVFSGEAQFDNNTQLVRIKKSDTLTLDGTNPAGFVIAKGVDNLPLDRWSNERAAYQDAYSYNNVGYGNHGLSAFGGYQDLAYYGGFMTVPGYGLAWQPYGAFSWGGWDPYLAGAWAFTPGLGYAWASAYPWGWLPYHYGSWAYTAGTGWFWYPGNAFSGGGAITNWQPTAPVVKGPPGYTAPTAPVNPVNGARPSVMVGRIGREPAYIPGGPVPPNFRSVITDHSGLTGMNAPSGGGALGGSSGFARNSRAANLSGVHTSAANASTFTSPAPAAASAGGHVFATPPQPAWNSQSYGWADNSGFGRSGGAAPAHSSVGTGRAGGTGGSHATSSANPK